MPQEIGPVALGTSNDNYLYYTGTRSQAYNPGSGLGRPDLSRRVGDFALRPGGDGHRS